MANDKTEEKPSVQESKPVKKQRTLSKKKKEKVTTHFSTIIQADGKDYDISGITERAFKQYKSVHKRKKVYSFSVYINLYDHCAYYSVNSGEDSGKINL